MRTERSIEHGETKVQASALRGQADHAVLKTEIRKVIKDAGVLALLDRIIDHNGNMPDGVGILEQKAGVV